MERKIEREHSVFDGWRYWRYIQFDSVKKTKILVLSVLEGNFYLQCKNSTSNLSKYLANRGNVKLKESPTDITATAAEVDSKSDGPTTAKQVKIELRGTGLGDAELKKLVAGYIVAVAFIYLQFFLLMQCS